MNGNTRYHEIRWSVENTRESEPRAGLTSSSILLATTHGLFD